MTQKTRRTRRLLPGLLAAVLALIVGNFLLNTLAPELKVRKLEQTEVPRWVDVQLIDVDGASRRGESLEAVRNIVVHYVGNPGTTAQANRDYFASSQSEVSSHFVVGLEGEIIQCIPLNEKSSASNHRNRDTISIEVCHPDESGKFNDDTYESLVRLTGWLLDVCGLESDDIIRHYDVTGKLCPLYYVEHEDAWARFREDVKNYRP